MKEPNYITRPKILAELKKLFKKYNIVITGCAGVNDAYIDTPTNRCTVDSCIANLDCNDIRIDDPHAT